MSRIQAVGITVCYASVAVAILSVMIPQKRTRRIMNFVIGLFFVGTLLSAVQTQIDDMDWSVPEASAAEMPSYNEDDFVNAVVQQTADDLTSAVDEMLCDEGIKPEDVQLTLKISDEGRISVVRAVIYISKNDSGKTAKIKDIVYRNILKEPEVYVKG